jgi:signal transduction histidine kinase
VRRRATVPVVSVLLALAFTLAFGSTSSHTTYAFFYPAVVVAVLYAGVEAGVIVAVAGALIGTLLVAPLRGQAIAAPSAALTSALLFFVISGSLAALANGVRRARNAAEATNQRLHSQARELAAKQAETQTLAQELEHANAELERAMLAAEGARDVALAGEARMRLVDEASRVLASSLDYETTVAAVAKLAVPTFADWCTVDLMVHGDIKQLAVAHVDPVRARWARELNAKYPTTLDPTTGVPHVIRTGEPILMSDVTDQMVAAVARDPEHLALLRSLEIRSSMIVPMTARGRTLGALMLVSTRPARRYGDVDLSVALDLARRAAMAIDNARLYRAALVANDAKTNFLATMSHELRTPLTAIIGYEELLAEGITGPVSEDQRQQLERIRVSATQLLSMIDEILLYARVESGSEAVRLEPVVAKGVVDDAVAFVAPSAIDRGLSLRAEPIDPGLMLRTDAGKLRQMLVNLLSNAVKFTTRGDVVVRAFAREDVIVFEVRDTGIGIDREDVEHIFDPFWQVEQTPTRKAGGSGLGLAVTRRLARLLGGDVVVRSEPFVGSTFRIELPAAPATPLESRVV